MDECRDVQYVTDDEGRPTAALVPIGLWREIMASHETEYLLCSPVMRDRLLAARSRTSGIPLEDALRKLALVDQPTPPRRPNR